MTFAAHKDLALDACSHFSASPTPFHNVANLVARLEEAGYQKLEESENFTGKVKGNGLYYYTRNTSTLCAFAIGGKYDPPLMAMVALKLLAATPTLLTSASR